MLTVDRFTKEFFIDRQNTAVLVLSETNRFYFTGFESSDGAVLLFKDARYLIVDFRYYEVAKSSVEGYSVILAERSILQIVTELCKTHSVSTVYIEDDFVTLSLSKKIEKQLDGINIECLGDTISKMRAVKTDSEIKAIKKAQELTDATFDHIINFIHRGLTENDVASEIDYYMRKHGAQGTAFKTICVSGKKSSLPHGEPSNLVLTEDSFLTMDFGARLDGYCADMTRTVVVGRADENMKMVYNTVLEAQLAALKVISAGVKGSVVDFAARDVINRAGYEKCFGHSTGHGLGIEVHESPSFSPRYTESIPMNAVLSVEPGIYIEDKYGVRIEDIVVVGEDKAVNLTGSIKNLIEIN